MTSIYIRFESKIISMKIRASHILYANKTHDLLFQCFPCICSKPGISLWQFLTIFLKDNKYINSKINLLYFNEYDTDLITWYLISYKIILFYTRYTLIIENFKSYFLIPVFHLSIISYTNGIPNFVGLNKIITKHPCLQGKERRVPIKFPI